MATQAEQAPHWFPQPNEKNICGIDVDAFVEHFSIGDPFVISVLRVHPALVCNLGKTRQEYREHVGAIRPVWTLVEGSGMFGLKDPQDAMWWRGIFNHGIGATRLTHWGARHFLDLSPREKQDFADKGFDPKSFEEIDLAVLLDYGLSNHSGRRGMDENERYGLRGYWHGPASWLNTERIYDTYNIDPRIRRFLRTEKHMHHLLRVRRGDGRTLFPNIVDNLIVIGDWMFNQKPVSLDERFEQLKTSNITTPEVLQILKPCAETFMDATREIMGKDFFDRMLQVRPYEWEKEIRQAYCVSAGLKVRDVFPAYDPI